MNHLKLYILGMLSVLLLAACQSKPKDQDLALSVVASSSKQWTGVAISQSGRLFVNYPYWSKNVPVSVAEIVDGQPRAYPNMDWNMRTGADSFHAVQSVYIDKKDRLWILDTNNAQFKGVAESGPVLFRFDLEKNKMQKRYTFPEGVFKSNSYFNDVRIDTEEEMAYITDSGDGAIIVLNLATGVAQRLLDDHPSTESETNHLVCDGHRWENSVHSDGIALSPDGTYLYYIALTGHTLYRIPTTALKNSTLPPKNLAKQVEKVKKVPATDGMLFDKTGHLYMGGLEDNSINKLTPDGEVEKVIQDSQIRWADSFTLDQEGNLYFTTSQIHLPQTERFKYEILVIHP